MISKKSYLLLFLFTLTTIGYGQTPVFEPDEYSILYEPNFQIKAKIKSWGEGKRFYTQTVSTKGSSTVLWNRKHPKRVDTYNQTKLAELPTPTGEKVEYAYTWTKKIDGVDSTKAFMWDTTLFPKPYYVYNLFDHKGRLEKTIRTSWEKDTIDKQTFQYDTLTRLIFSGKSICSECGVQMHVDSVTNIVSWVKKCDGCVMEKSTFQYETDQQGRIRKKRIETAKYNTLEVTEIYTSYHGRRQINLYYFEKHNPYVQNDPPVKQVTQLPRRFRSGFKDLPQHINSYSVALYDKKKRPKVYRYHSSRSDMIKRYKYL